MLTHNKLKNEFITFDFETRDTYIGRKMGAGWVYSLNYPDVSDAYTVSVAVYDSKADTMNYFHTTDNKTHSYKDVKEFSIGDADILVGQNLQYDLGWYLADNCTGAQEGIAMLRKMYRDGVVLVDTKLMAKLVDEFKMSYSLSALTKEYRVTAKSTKLLADAVFETGLYTEVKSTEGRNFVNRPSKDAPLLKIAYQNMHRLPVDIVAEYCIDDVKGTTELYQKLLSEMMNEYGEEATLMLIKKYSTLQYAVMEMRINGLVIDNKLLAENHKELGKMLLAAQKKLNELVGGVEVNAAATSSLHSAYLSYGYKESQIPKTDKGNPSIVQKWLDSQNNELSSAILRVRQLTKIIGTFMDSLRTLQDHLQMSTSELGHVHGEFNIFGTHTGRFTCSSPNVQQIPKRNPEFYKVCRGMFVAPPGEKFIASDYSNQEGRIQVHYGTLLGAEGASEICHAWNVEPSLDFHQKVAEIVGLDRSSAKGINLGKSYGMGEAKLCESLGLPTIMAHTKHGERLVAGIEGKRIIDKYNDLFPFIGEATNTCRAVQKTKGFMRSLGGRHIHAERIKINGRTKLKYFKAFSQLIQGSAADQLIQTLVDFYDYICYNEDTKIILRGVVHDEILFTVPEDTADECKEIIERIMTQSVKLEVPMLVDTHMGNSWYEGGE